MRGPSERLKYDLRRVWECPVCHRRERTAGTVTFRHCPCQVKQIDGRQVPMKLIVDGVQRLTPPIHIQVSSEPAAVMESLPSGETVNAEPAAVQIVEPAVDDPQPPRTAF